MDLVARRRDAEEWLAEVSPEDFGELLMSSTEVMFYSDEIVRLPQLLAVKAHRATIAKDPTSATLLAILKAAEDDTERRELLAVALGRRPHEALRTWQDHRAEAGLGDWALP